MPDTLWCQSLFPSLPPGSSWVDKYLHNSKRCIDHKQNSRKRKAAQIFARTNQNASQDFLLQDRRRASLSDGRRKALASMRTSLLFLERPLRSILRRGEGDPSWWFDKLEERPPATSRTSLPIFVSQSANQRSGSIILE
jgi:hypothetical protein